MRLRTSGSEKTIIKELDRNKMRLDGGYGQDGRKNSMMNQNHPMSDDQTWFMVKLQSGLRVCLVCLILIASRTLLLYRLGSRWIAESQATGCCVFQACAGIPLFVLLVFTTYSCGF